MKKQIVLPAALALFALSACDSETGASTASGTELTDATLGEAMASEPQASGLVAAIDKAGLSEIFSAPAGYTVIAPPNEAFEGVGDGTGGVPTAVLAAMLREHMLPGQLDIDAIRAAIGENGGKVTLATLGTGMIEFTLDGETVVATHVDSKQQVRLTGSGVQANNGALLLADGLLVAPPAPASSQS